MFFAKSLEFRIDTQLFFEVSVNLKSEGIERGHTHRHSLLPPPTPHSKPTMPKRQRGEGNRGKGAKQSNNSKKSKSGRTKHVKVVVGWDESERADYLTGFRKRKQQRREQAIVEMVEKARKDKLLEREEARKDNPTFVPPSDDSDSEEEQVEQVSFADDFSKEHLGAANVTVTTVVGFDGGDSDDDVDSLKEKLLERKKTSKKRNLAAEEKRLVKSQEARVKRMKEILLKSKRKGPGKGSKARRRSGAKHSKGKRSK